GEPMVLSDAPEGLALLQVLSGWRQALAVGLLSAWTLAMLASSWPASMRHGAWLALPAGWVLCLLALPAPVAGLLQALDGTGRISEGAMLMERGSIAYIVRARHEGVEELSYAPSREEVIEALGALEITASKPATVGFRRRSVHVVLLESMWDATGLQGYGFSADPFDPAFRAAWEAGGRSTVMVPSFG